MKVAGKPYRTIWPHDDGSVEVIDQTKLPHAFETVRLKSVHDAAHAIKTMVVRGAPLIGATAAYGVALAMREDASDAALDRAHDLLLATRPTAVNLRWALAAHARPSAQPPARGARASARGPKPPRSATRMSRPAAAIGEHGLALSARGRQEGSAARGSTFSPIATPAGSPASIGARRWRRSIWRTMRGIPLHVWVDETRPRNQGASLTAFELGGHGVPHTIIADNAGGHLMQHRARSISASSAPTASAANGDVANKIGTYLKALAAHDNDVPFYVALPALHHRLDASRMARDIPIEERSRRRSAEDRPGACADGGLATVEIAARGSPAANPGFDVTPARLVTRLHHRTRHLRRLARGACCRSFPNAAKNRTRNEKPLVRRRSARTSSRAMQPQGVSEDLALRVYTTRLLGGDPRLVLHGGGNTSVKTEMTDLLGDARRTCICVKGSGWDMGDIEPAGLPAVRLAPLRRLRALDRLSDEDMVNFQRVNLLDSDRAQSVGRNAAARLPAAQIRRPHPFDRGARADRPAGRREHLPRRLRRARRAMCPTSCRALRWPRASAEIFDRPSRRRRSVLLQHGIFTVRRRCARSL